MNAYELFLMACLGVGLAAACGFRVFVPPFLMSIAGRAEFAGVDFAGSEFAWLSSTPAMVALGSATMLEIAAYYVPWLDNILDSISTPSSVIAGVLMTGVALEGADPVLQWAFALIAGGGVAGTIQLSTVATRAISTVFSGGLGNGLVSTGEAGASLFCVVLAIFIPIVAMFVVIGFLVVAIAVLRRATAKRAKN